MAQTLEQSLSAIRQKIQDSQIWANIHSYLHSRIVLQFDKLSKGGSNRGSTWEYFKTAWYARSDGTEVPIWGGIRKARGQGIVKGKLRSKNPEGKKTYKRGDSLMQSTGILRGALLADLRVNMSAVEMRTPVKYAGFQEALRPWNYVTDEESSMIMSMISRQLDK